MKNLQWILSTLAILSLGCVGGTRGPITGGSPDDTATAYLLGGAFTNDAASGKAKNVVYIGEKNSLAFTLENAGSDWHLKGADTVPAYKSSFLTSGPPSSVFYLCTGTDVTFEEKNVTPAIGWNVALFTSGETPCSTGKGLPYLGVGLVQKKATMTKGQTAVFTLADVTTSQKSGPLELDFQGFGLDTSAWETSVAQVAVPLVAATPGPENLPLDVNLELGDTVYVSNRANPIASSLVLTLANTSGQPLEPADTKKDKWGNPKIAVSFLEGSPTTRGVLASHDQVKKIDVALPDSERQKWSTGKDTNASPVEFSIEPQYGENTEILGPKDNVQILFTNIESFNTIVPDETLMSVTVDGIPGYSAQTYQLTIKKKKPQPGILEAMAFPSYVEAGQTTNLYWQVNGIAWVALVWGKDCPGSDCVDSKTGAIPLNAASGHSITPLEDAQYQLYAYVSEQSKLGDKPDFIASFPLVVSPPPAAITEFTGELQLSSSSALKAVTADLIWSTTHAEQCFILDSQVDCNPAAPKTYTVPTPVPLETTFLLKAVGGTGEPATSKIRVRWGTDPAKVPDPKGLLKYGGYFAISPHEGKVFYGTAMIDTANEPFSVTALPFPKLDDVGLGAPGVSPDGSTFFLPVYNYNLVLAFDISTRPVKLLQKISTDGWPWSVSVTPDGTRAFVAATKIDWIDTTVHPMTATSMPKSNTSRWNASTPDGSSVFFTIVIVGSSGYAYQILDTSNMEVSLGGYWPQCSRPEITPGGSKFVAACSDEFTTFVLAIGPLDHLSNMQTVKLKGGDYASNNVAVSPGGSLAFVPAIDANSVYVVEIEKPNAPATTISDPEKIFQSPESAVVSSDGLLFIGSGKGYVAYMTLPWIGGGKPAMKFGSRVGVRSRLETSLGARRAKNFQVWSILHPGLLGDFLFVDPSNPNSTDPVTYGSTVALRSAVLDQYLSATDKEETWHPVTLSSTLGETEEWIVIDPLNEASKAPLAAGDTIALKSKKYGTCLSKMAAPNLKTSNVKLVDHCAQWEFWSFEAPYWPHLVKPDTGNESTSGKE